MGHISHKICTERMKLMIPGQLKRSYTRDVNLRLYLGRMIVSNDTDRGHNGMAKAEIINKQMAFIIIEYIHSIVQYRVILRKYWVLDTGIKGYVFLTFV